jgi:hypothetical protein
MMLVHFFYYLTEYAKNRFVTFYNYFMCCMPYFVILPKTVSKVIVNIKNEKTQRIKGFLQRPDHGNANGSFLCFGKRKERPGFLFFL